ncbi:MAG: ribosome-associated translation inhibitor RaiA [Candidatus Taylorbacteria bacterium]
MNTHIKTTAVTLTPAISEYINRHIAKIEHLFNADDSVKCDIELAKTTNHHQKGDIFRAEIHIVGHKQNIFAAADRQDLLVAIDEAFSDTLFSMTSRRKKVIALARHGGAKVKAMVRGLWPFGTSEDL